MRRLSFPIYLTCVGILIFFGWTVSVMWFVFPLPDPRRLEVLGAAASERLVDGDAGTSRVVDGESPPSPALAPGRENRARALVVGR